MRLDEGDGKLLKCILDRNQGADLEIAWSHFVIRYGWYPSRHRYFLDAAGGVASGLMEWCGIERVLEPCVAVMPGRSNARVGRLTLTFQTQHVWFLPGEAILVVVRPASERAEPPSITAPPPPIRYVHRSLAVPDGCACPHCAVVSDTLRVIGEALICPACHRSFEAASPTDGEL